jgi:hypothetical protein
VGSVIKIKRAALVAALLVLFIAAGNLITGSICYFRAVPGVPCPGCGLTRAYLSLAAGNIRGAFEWHPLFWLVPVFIGMGILKKIKSPKAPYKPFNLFAISAAVLAVAVFIVRLMFLFPHTEPLTLNPNAIIPRIFRTLCYLAASTPI